MLRSFGVARLARGSLACAQAFLKPQARLCKGGRIPKSIGQMYSVNCQPPPVQPGEDISNVPTPALLVDLDGLEANCARLKKSMESFPSVNIRVHCKAHKCAPLAEILLDKVGGRGVCCQKLTEAEAMVEGGVLDVFLSNEVVSPPKLERFMDLALKGASLRICVDDMNNAVSVSKTASLKRAEVGILVELNVGQNRCGVDTPQEVLELAQKISQLDGVTFEGIQAYQGGLQHIRDPVDRSNMVQQVAWKAKETVDLLKSHGISCNVVTGGGSGTYKIDASSGIFTEIQPGSFCFSDVDYAENIQEDGSVGEWCHSLFVLSTVMSRNVKAKRVVVDAGLKALSFDSGPPRPWPKEHYSGVEFQNGGDEHGIMIWPKDCTDDIPEIGTTIKLIPGHCDPTVNMYDWIIGFRRDVVERVWSINGRGPGL